MSSSPDPLPRDPLPQWKELETRHHVETPESVAFAYTVVGIGNRSLAALLDAAILAVLNVLLVILMAGLFSYLEGPLDTLRRTEWMQDQADLVAGLILALVIFLYFLLNMGYFILFEILWNGQTPGKRWAGIRVIRQGGRPVDFLSVAVRNLVRVVDFFPFGYLVGLVVMLVDSQARRLGDLAAGTLVVKDQAPVTLERVLTATRRPHLTTDQDLEASLAFPGIRNLRHRDYALLQESLHRFDQGTLNGHTLLRLAQVIARRVGADPPQHIHTGRRLLEQVAQAYQALEKEKESQKP